MDEFARRDVADRRAFIEEAASRRDLTPTIIEKDFWVCWTLRRLMTCEELNGHLMFKGGTSLSKAYDIIHRFSEDIDLTISKGAPRVSEVNSPMEDGISGKERQRRTKALKEAAQGYVAKDIMPVLAREIEAALGTPDGWSLELDPDDNDRQTLLFNYPQTSGYGLNYGNDYGGGADGGYIKPRIKLEFGARGDTEPSELKTITPYLAAEFPDELPDAIAEIPTLAATRTFWEKVTILHMLYHSGKLRDGMSRHYYDTLMLTRAGIDREAMRQPELLANVVRNKSLMFADKSASYETALLGSLRLSPPDAIADDLKRDYDAMAVMFMREPPTFAELLADITALEEWLNAEK
ncbi:nucleotidyl transferase AbiEii/AbiGii toxin family protein [Roseibium sp.]|jgi:hypothetical protein|uniref:nucleotidyl transferase AbiEii/AbiGii toxin family protein n=1 Tax=Roseibium sp. TaxID=1936156 RepID=UPI00329988BB|tara:strand:+ start:34973 stop:36025 length:1053 start_codon:yes stop_codon:yes gene_type:complete